MATVEELASNFCVDVIHDKVTDIGRVAPVGSVSIQQWGGNMFLRKLCLFSFFSPFEVKTKFYDSEMSDLFFQNHIQNISSSTIFIQKVSLEPSEMYIVVELNTVNQAGEYECAFGTRTFLQSVEGCQYLYHLQLKQEFSEKSAPIRGLAAMGKLDIV